MFAVGLVNPKYDYNVGGVIRATACFEGDHVVYSNDRWATGRDPIELRRNIYNVDCFRNDRFITESSLTPIAVELMPGAQSLPDFKHPENALYVFGPEDGTLDRAWLTRCHEFVQIPMAQDLCANLSAAVNIVLYDRLAKGMV